MKYLLIALLALLAAPAMAATFKPLVQNGGFPAQIPAASTLILPAPTTANASINLPAGTAPTSPNNGDLWTTTAGVFARINGATQGPYTGNLGTVTVNGTPTPGDCVSWFSTTAIQDAGSACASGGGGAAVPQGRLTLLTGTPVMTSDQTAKGTIYYDCYLGASVPYWSGSATLTDTIGSCEVSDVMSSAGASAIGTAGVFDLWWVHAHTGICIATSGTGFGWSGDTGGSNTARGTGYSQVHNTKGYWTNVNSIAHCYNNTTDYGSLSADTATYLGTIYTTGAAQTGVALHPSATAGGTGNVLGVWNAYNRVNVTAVEKDTTTGNTQNSGDNAWHQFVPSSANDVVYVDGLGISPTQATFSALANEAANVSDWIGLNLDSSSATPEVTAVAFPGSSVVSTQVAQLAVSNGFYPAIGLHTIYAMGLISSGTGEAPWRRCLAPAKSARSSSPWRCNGRYRFQHRRWHSPDCGGAHRRPRGVELAIRVKPQGGLRMPSIPVT